MSLEFLDVRDKHLATKVVRAGELHGLSPAPVVTPIYQAATYFYEDQLAYHDCLYARLSNSPSHLALHSKLAQLEGAEAALVSSSGMATITGCLMAMLNSGDHLLIQRTLYGGTKHFVLHEIKRLGVEVEFFDDDQIDQLDDLRKPSTTAIYCEAIANPTAQPAQVSKILSFAKKYHLLSIIDATFASPINLRPIELGFDLCIHSATKFLNGHSDVLAGVVAGKASLIEKLRLHQDLYGGALEAFGCFLLERGLKTLSVRMKQMNQNAQSIAEFLNQHPKIEKVNYGGLRASEFQEFFGFGGMISFEPKCDQADSQNLVESFRVISHAPSLGGVESLALVPSKTIHSELSSDQRYKMRISDSLIRLSVGIEEVQDLIEDLDQALARI